MVVWRDDFPSCWSNFVVRVVMEDAWVMGPEQLVCLMLVKFCKSVAAVWV